MARTFVFSGDSLIRFSNGRILVHTTSSRLPAFETDQSMLIGWVARFKVPSDVEAAIAELPQGDRQMAAQVVNYLIRSGVLVEAGTADAADRTPSDSAVLIRNHLRLLARSVYDLACDVLGLGPEVSEKALAQQTGIGLERRLIAALASLEALRNGLLPLRHSRVGQQLSALGVDATTKNLKLHIGCGEGHLSGW